MAGDSCWAAVDRQWSWIIVLGVSTSFMIMDGFTRGFGVFFSVFLLEFGGSASATTLMYSLRNALFVVLCKSGPLAAGLGDWFGERVLVMAGGVILSLAYVLNFFAPNLAYVIVFLGFVNGLGSVMIVTCLPTVIGKHFQTRRSLATSMGYAGSGLGQLLIPHLIVYLVEIYGVRGMLLIFGGIQLHNVAIGALFMPVEKLVKIKRLCSNRIEERKDQPSGEMTVFVGEQMQDDCIEDNVLTNERYPHSRSCQLESDSIALDNNKGDGVREKMLKEKNPAALNKSSDLDSNKEQDVTYTDSQSYSRVSADGQSLHVDHSTDKQKQGCYKKYILFCDMTLLLNPTLMLYFLATGIAAAGFVCQVTFMVPRAVEMGVSLKQAAILLSISGAIDIFGRIAMGALADVKAIGPIRIMISYTMIIGIANTIYPSCEGFPSMVGYSVVLGIVGSGGHILIMPTLVELEGTGRLARGVGWVLLHQGFCGTVIPPLMGLIRDRTASYVGIFYACAAFQLCASALMAFVLYLHCRRHNIPFCAIKLLNRTRREEHTAKHEIPAGVYEHN